MDSRAELKKSYKENPPAAGIYQVKNTANGKVFLGKALNVRGKINGVLFSLQQGSHLNHTLQTEWKHYGQAAFVLEVLDELKPAAGEAAVDPKELEALEALWFEKLQPYGERGYHALPVKK